jgi:hypothetical protein
MRRSVPWLLLAAALTLRVIYFSQLDATPFIHMERWAQTDMHYYDGWARQIASGDWLSRTVPMPMHRWHHEVAQAYFRTHPDARASFGRDGRDPDAALWAQWMGAPRFYQDPLYPYLIALVYRFISPDVRAVLAVQLGAGALSVLLIWSIARRHFGDAAGTWAGLLAVFCAPLVFYELLLMRDSLIACAGLAIVWLADRAIDTSRRRWFASLGVTLGLAYLLKSSFAVLAVLIVPVVLAVPADRSWRRRLPPAAALAAGLAVALAPLVVRNVRVGVAPLSMASSGPLTFLSSNDVNALPDVGFGIDTPLLARFLGETDGSWRTATTVAASGHDVSSYGAMLWRKWDRAWHWFEIPNNENFYYFREQAPVLAWLPVTCWTVAPLALVGLALLVRRPRVPWTLAALVVASAGTLVAFYVLGRFRVALVAAAIPMAAFAAAELTSALRSLRVARALVIAGTIAVLALWTGRPLADDQVLLRTSDYILAWSVEYQDRVYGSLDRKDPAAAGAAYQEFFARFEPPFPEIAAASDPRLVPELADMHAECAQILQAAGRAEAAAIQFDAARRILALRPAH